MAVCLDYQSVYYSRRSFVLSVRLQIIAAALLLLVLVCKVWIKIETTNLGYQLAEQRQQTVEYDMQRRELSLQLSVLMRPDNLAQLAHEKLGLESLNTARARKIRY